MDIDVDAQTLTYVARSAPLMRGLKLLISSQRAARSVAKSRGLPR